MYICTYAKQTVTVARFLSTNWSFLIFHKSFCSSTFANGLMRWWRCANKQAWEALLFVQWCECNSKFHPPLDVMCKFCGNLISNLD